MKELLRINNVSKLFKDRKALHNINISIEHKEIIGLVGPNGAGKTTLMKIITGLIQKYDGEVYINNKNIKDIKNLDKKMIGCVIESPGFYPNLTGYENLLYFSEISGLKDKSMIDEIIKELEIDEYIGKKAKTYSLGMKQRLGIAQAVLSYPPLLILDEPTNGLDPAIVPKLRNYIKNLVKEKGTTVLISSHVLTEIEAMCDRVIFIEKGNVIKVEDLKNKNLDDKIISIVSSEIDKLKILFDKLEIKSEIKKEDTIYVYIKNDQLELINESIINEGIKFKYIQEVTESLEKRYLKTIGESDYE